MKNSQLSLLVLLFHATGFEAKGYTKNVPTYEIGPGAKINGNKITYDEPGCDDGLDCSATKACSQAGYTPSLSEDKKYFACCAAGQRLLGSPDTAFDCCADGHDLVGDSHCGYHCCPTGFTFDGQQCKELCKNGKALVDGNCVCPKGTTESPDGTCQKKPEPGKCTSGLESGKCYVFKADNGNRLGLAGDNVYYAGAESMTQRYGKFQLCLDEKCAPGQEINPSSEVYIRDTYGDLATGANKNQWLIHAYNGGHIGRTPLFSMAGHFSISKWPCGKYCLGGVTEGVGPACPAITPALTFYTQDPQMCVEFEFTEVPCDIHSNANNCIWKKNASPDNASPDNASPDSALPDNSSPSNASPNKALTNTASSENSSPSNASPNNVSPDNARNQEAPLSYGTTLLIAAASLALFTIFSRLPKGSIAQIMGPKDRVAQAVALNDSVPSVLPEKDDIDQLSKKTNESVSRYTTAALSRYTTKSRTVVSTSKINHNEVISEHLESESNNTTPEELSL
ncbi:hypothetical protein E0Z10_g10145 [Xylaria hypoxylon]|uniref:Cystein rich protein n=1 Tax=Xylaria hypoxylon TaxID=37992 RepID=A0A4Z0YLT4_9PEZI|nr:hypothetical protein E0Z10_g10145 [Xylaria hypoxylon]